MHLQNDAPILAPISELDYFDQRGITLARPLEALEAWNVIMAEPSPVLALAFRIRDAISGLFGVRNIGGFSGERRETVSPGDRLDFFLVEAASPNLLVLSERDRHLDVMTCITTHGPRVTITSSVVTHNWFGRAYMVPVGIAHKGIVSAMLKRLEQRVLESHADR